MQSFLKGRKLLSLLLLVGMLLFLNLSSERVRGTFSFALSPVQSFLWKTGTSSARLFSGVSKDRVRQLEAENFSLRQELLLFQETEKENARLRQAFEGLPRAEHKLVFAEIIGKEVDRDVLILKKGAAEGIAQGMPVITQSKVAVGSIGEVFEHTSKVQLLSLKGRAFDIKIQGKEIIGALQGQGRYRARLDLIPREEELQEGEVVVTSALSGVFPDNLLVGELLSIEKSDLTAFQGGKVELFFHPRKENSLFVITDYK